MPPGSHPPDDFALLISLGVGFLTAGNPSMVAFRRDHPNRWVILLINLAFGGTLAGESRWSGRCGRLTA